MMNINDLKDKFNEYKKNRIFVAVSIAVLVVVICLIAYAVSYHLGLKNREEQFDQLREAQLEEIPEATEVETTEAAENDSCEMIYDFAKLRETNEDIYAWITVPGTQVDYPVLQSDTDNYYLNHNLDLSGGYPGCIYTNLCNQQDFSDLITVLYGHNMKNGSMFGCLHEFEDESFFEENRQIIVYTEEKRIVYDIYAAVKFSDVYIPAYYEVNTVVDKSRFLADVVTYSDNEISHIREGEIASDTPIIVLSTCVSGEGDRRFLIVGELVESTPYEQE